MPRQPENGPRRIALTLPGVAALGAFQAGAVCALVIAVQAVNQEDRKRDGKQDRGAVSIDVITGASSGSLTAVLTAKALVSGEDPMASFHRAWVTEPTVAALSAKDTTAPLTLEWARTVAVLLLNRPPTDTAEDREAKQQLDAVVLELALTSLRGFTYAIGSGRDPRTIEATSYLDWARHDFSAGDQHPAEWTRAVDSAIASASHPLAFAPSVLRRDPGPYADNGVTNVPSDPELWYVDGGLLDREPVGRCVRMAREHDADGGDISRRVLVIRPDSDDGPPQDDPSWTDADNRPTWKAALARSLRILVTHSLYEDLRRVEKTNTRIAASEALIEDVLHPLLAEHPNPDKVARVLRRFVAVREDALKAVRRTDRRRGRPRVEPKEELADLLGQALEYASGLQSKVLAEVLIVSPRHGELAGGSLGFFGGFLAQRLRANDFLVGYRTMMDVLEREDILPADVRETGGDAVRRRAASVPGWAGGVRAGPRLPLHTRVDVARVALRAGRLGILSRQR